MPHLTRPSDCRGCPLDNLADGFSRPEGTGVCKVGIIGESLGYHEANDGLPFRPHAPAGHVLEQAIKRLGMNRQQFSLWNLCACRPPSNELSGAPYEMQAIEHCKVHFRRYMNQFQPRVLLACGALPTRVLTGLTGKKLTVEMLQGYVLEALEYPGVFVIPTYHPSYIQRGAWEVLPVLIRAIKLAVLVAKEGWTRPELSYSPDACAAEIREYAEYLEAHPDVTLSVDFETHNKEEKTDELIQIFGAVEDGEEDPPPAEFLPAEEQIITQVNLCFEKGVALATTFEADKREQVERCLRTQNPKTGHNFWMFDQVVAGANDVVINGRVDDTMWRFHHIYPDLPGKRGKVSGGNQGVDKKDEGSLANLQFCASFYGFHEPWKHLVDQDPGYYGCCDAHAGLLVHLGTEHELDQLKIRQGYENMVYRILPILQDGQQRGIPMNRAKLIAFVKSLIIRGDEKRAQISPLIPEEVLSSKQKSGLKKTPKDVDGLVERTFVLLDPEKCGCVRKKKAHTCKRCKGQGGYFADSGQVATCLDCSGEGIVPERVTVDPECSLCKGTGEVIGEVTRWCRLKEFNPNSSEQLKSYAHYRHHKIPKNSKRKFAMDKETLRKMAKSTKDPVYGLTVESRELNKMQTTYGEGWLKRLDKDDLIHTQFSFLPATGQLSCLDGDVPVSTLRGLVPMRDVRVGDFVWTHRSRWMPVIATYLKGVSPMFRLELNGGSVLTGTADHRILAYVHKSKLAHFKEFERVEEQSTTPRCVDECSACYGTGNYDAHHSSRAKNGFYARAVQRTEKTTLLTKQDGQQIWNKGKETVLGWARVSDILDAFGETLCTSIGVSEDVELEKASKGHDSSSYRWESTQQRVEQLSLSNECRTQEIGVLAKGTGGTWRNDTIKAAYSVGRLQVFDISVGEDYSYEAGGVFNHNSINPNVQNRPSVSKYGKLAEEFGETIEARPGHVILTADYCGYHSQTLAWESKDWDLLRVAKIDPHSFLTAHLIRHPDRDKMFGWDDEKLRAFLKGIKKEHIQVRNAKAKPAFLGIGFGLQAESLFLQNPDSFTSKDDSKQTLDILNGIFSICYKFRQEVPLRAKRNGNRLVSVFGCLRWFWNIEDWDFNNRRPKHGTDWERAIAFLPANDAFCHKKLALLRIDESILDGQRLTDRYGWINDVHDEFQFHVRRELVEECVHYVGQEMQAPSEVMLMPDGSGFQVNVEFKVGPDLGHMQDWKGGL